jgi:hypothetical protein
MYMLACSSRGLTRLPDQVLCVVCIILKFPWYPANHLAVGICCNTGTVFANGFEEGIGMHGIDRGNGAHSTLPMKERVAVICKLGMGCSGIVYKALDISPLRIVALKTVPVHDR